jgi:hypothetical protein
MNDGGFQVRVAALLEREGTVLNAQQLDRMAERYRHCPGKERWDVREYRGALTHLGAREYRVMRGSSVQDVFSSVERDSATAVRTALNELEAQGNQRWD